MNNNKAEKTYLLLKNEIIDVIVIWLIFED